MGAMKGLLRISGTIDLSQFWPNGKSDADTATVVANVNGFEFSSDGSLRGLRRTRVFEAAQIDGKNVIKTDRKVTIRIQGIDAPELHCPPGVRKPQGFPKKKPLKGNGGLFRQLQGETATVATDGSRSANRVRNQTATRSRIKICRLAFSYPTGPSRGPKAPHHDTVRKIRTQLFVAPNFTQG